MPGYWVAQTWPCGSVLHYHKIEQDDCADRDRIYEKVYLVVVFINTVFAAFFSFGRTGVSAGLVNDNAESWSYRQRNKVDRKINESAMVLTK